MFDMMTLVGWFLAGSLAAMPQQSGGDSTVTARPVRFFSPGTGSTMIEGTSEIQLGGFVGQGATSRYRVEVAIADSAGLELVRNSWLREVPTEAARAPGASAIESFGFAAVPGRYRITVRATAEGREARERSMEVGAFGVRPLVSDLLLATASREAADTSSPAPGEIRRGRLVLRTAPVPHLTFAEAGLTYYTEIYPWPGFTGAEMQLALEVFSEAGRSMIRAAAQPRRLGSAGGVARGTMDLSGLPAGQYRLRATITVGDSTGRVESPFSMGPVRQVVTATAAATPAPGPFDEVNELVLDSMYAPLVVLAQASELGTYDNLTVDGKRRFLTEFWRRRDPTPNTPDNPLRDTFYRGVRYANQTFREGGAAQIPGWRTDRGRVYLKHGQPLETFRRPQANPRAFEVWLYTQSGRARYYAFYDNTNLGHYRIAGTNDISETGFDQNQPNNWISALTQDQQLRTDILNFIQR